jgi:hypothetical protein
MASTVARRRSAPRRPVQRVVSAEHLVTVAAAIGVFASAIPSGAYSPQARAILAVLVWWLVAGGLVLRFLPRAPVPSLAVVAGALVAALDGLTALSIGWASDNGGAFDEAVRAAGYAGVFALVVLAAPAGSARAWLAGMALGLVVVTVLALGSRMVPSAFPDQGLVEALPETRGRLSYPLGYWNGLGALMALTAVLLVAMAGIARTLLGRTLATAAIPLPSLALFLTSSRGAVIALAAGLAILFVIGLDRVRMAAAVAIGGAGAGLLIGAAVARDLFTDGRTGAAGYTGEANELILLTLVVVAGGLTVRPMVDGLVERIRVPPGLARGAAAGAIVVLALALVAVNPVERWDELKRPPDTGQAVEGRGLVTEHLTSTEGTGRYQFWHAGWTAFKHRPLLGVGAAGYEPWWAQHGSLDYFVRNAHSLPIEIAAELGAVGLLLLLGFFGVVALTGARARLARAGTDRAAAAAGLALLGAGFAAAAVEWTWEIPGAFVPVAITAGVLAGPALLHAQGAYRRPRADRLLAGATVAVACAGIVAGGILLTSDAKLRASQQAGRDGDLAKAARDARSAIAIEPWAAEPRLQLALAEESRDIGAANTAVNEAIERSPEDWRIWYIAARMRSAAEDQAGTLRALARARALAPPSPALERLLGPASRR